jgi:DNA polymerase-3 subunit gamma/tau
MAVLQAVPGRAGSPATLEDPDAAEIERLSQTMPADETQLLYSLCLHGRAELGLAPDEYAALTMVLLRLLAFKPSAGLAEKKTLKSGPEAVSPGAVAAPPREPLVVRAPEMVQPSALATPPAVVAPAAPVEAPPPAVETPVVARQIEAAVVRPIAAKPPVAQEEAASDDEPPPWEELSTEPPPTRVAAPASAPHPPPRQSMMSIPVRDAGPSERLDQRRDPVGATAPATTLQPTPEGEFWMEAVQALVDAEAVTALVRELALQSQLLARDGGRWVLRVERESLNQSNAPERLASALVAQGHDGVKLVVEIGSVSDSPALRLAALAAQKQRQAEALILGDPFVQTMMRDFGGKIVPGTLKATA